MLKAISTKYKGYFFRSRLEARWAMFFEELGFNWTYEEQGYELPTGHRYLPDFKVTSPQGLVTYYEVKPRGVTHDVKFDAFRAALAALAPKPPANGFESAGSIRDEKTGHSVLYSFVKALADYERNGKPQAKLLPGDPVDWFEASSGSAIPGGVCPRCGSLHSKYLFAGVEAYEGLTTLVCVRCVDAFGSSGEVNRRPWAQEGVLARTELFLYKQRPPVLLTSTEDWLRSQRRVARAAEAARSARF